MRYVSNEDMHDEVLGCEAEDGETVAVNEHGDVFAFEILLVLDTIVHRLVDPELDLLVIGGSRLSRGSSNIPRLQQYT